MRENDGVAEKEIHSHGTRSRYRLVAMNEPIAGLALLRQTAPGLASVVACRPKHLGSPNRFCTFWA